MSCETEEERKEMLKPFYQKKTGEELFTTPSPPSERVFVCTYYSDFGNRDIGFRNT